MPSLKYTHELVKRVLLGITLSIYHLTVILAYLCGSCNWLRLYWAKYADMMLENDMNAMLRADSVMDVIVP